MWHTIKNTEALELEIEIYFDFGLRHKTLQKSET